MTNVISFNYNTNAIRTQVTDDGEPLFCANDVCEALGYANPCDAVKQHVDINYDLMECEVADSLGHPQQTNFVTEAGLYALIYGSKLETAMEFKRWVTLKVLPSIRKTGRYEASQPTQPCCPPKWMNLLAHRSPEPISFFGTSVLLPST